MSILWFRMQWVGCILEASLNVFECVFIRSGIGRRFPGCRFPVALLQLRHGADSYAHADDEGAQR